MNNSHASSETELQQVHNLGEARHLSITITRVSKPIALAVDSRLLQTKRVTKQLGPLITCLLSHDRFSPLPISLVLNPTPTIKVHQPLAIFGDPLRILSVWNNHSPMEMNVNITTHTCYQFWFPISVKITNFQGQ